MENSILTHTMPKVTIIQQVFRSRKWMELVYPAMAAQTFKDVQIVAQIVEDDGNEANGGACEDYIKNNFPNIILEKPGYNIGFAKGHNELLEKYDSEFYQLVNPDLVLEPNYIEEVLKVFEENPKLGAVTGKLLQCSLSTDARPLSTFGHSPLARGELSNVFLLKSDTIDTTGVVVSRNGRARDRGQHEKDIGQYDDKKEVVAVSGAGPMYRMAALEDVKIPRLSSPRSSLSFPRSRESLQESNVRVVDSYVQDSKDSHLRGNDKRCEYFDEDFGSYWEDVDLSLRTQSRGWQCAFVPRAVAFHGRTAASAKKDYANVVAYKKHHDSLPARIKQLNYKNHIFLAVKNFPTFSWKFFLREFIMLGYIILLETSTLKILPIFFRQLPKMLQKRKFIKKNRKSQEWLKLLNNKGLLS